MLRVSSSVLVLAPHPCTHTHTHHTRVAYACSRSTSDTHVRCYLTPVQVVSIEGYTILTQDGYKDSASVSLLHSP